jgi:hypothetical protein
MKRRALGFVVAALAIAAEAHADEPVVSYPMADDAATRAWRAHREGPHMAFELGFGAMYAPDLPVEITSDPAPADIVSFSSNGLLGPAGNLRWGVNFGISPAVDVRLGFGSFLGGAILEHDDIFFAYPHAALHVSFGPGQIYRARVGVVTGALVFDQDKQPRRLPPALFGVHGEVSPLILQFGDYSQFEFSVTQGLGVFVGDFVAADACAGLSGLGGCVAADGVSGEEPSIAQFGGHTMIAFGAVLD